MSFTKISGQDRVKSILKKAFLKGRIPSAYLFVGPDRENKLQMAKEFAKLVDCGEGTEKVCGKCESCNKIDRGIHPDVWIVQPEGSSIKIDKIRELSSFVRFGPTLGKYKVLIVDVADYMTTEAYTSFLKTLEEPKEGVLFILLTSREELLPDTVVSRCQKVVFSEEGKVLVLEEAEMKEFSGTLAELKNSDEGKLIGLWSDFAGTEEIKEKLNKFISYMWQKAKSRTNKRVLRAVKIVSECYHSIEKRANQRLALDVMFLNLKEVLYGK